MSALSAQKGWALRRDEWENYLRLHGHAEAVNAFMRLPHERIDGVTYWRLMAGFVWWRTENFTERWLWRGLLQRHPEHRAAMMSDAEQGKLASLPEQVEVWRGVSDAEYAEGFSWTLSRRQAHWFAKRFAFEGTSPRLLRGSIARTDVIAFLDGRSEQEIVAFPESVEILSESRLRTHSAMPRR